MLTTQEFGQTLRKARKELGISQQELAERAGCSQKFVSELERGKATAEIGLAFKVADALNLHVLLAAKPVANQNVRTVEELVRRTARQLDKATNTRPRLSDYLT